MALSVKHHFTSAKSDGLDTTKVQPSNWNAEHDLTAAVDKILGTDSGSTTVKELACTAQGRAAIASTTQIMTVPLGASFAWHTNTLPVVDSGIEVGWLNGQSLDRTTYAALFALYGTTYGNVDGTHFNVPNGCEVAMVGRSTMGGAASRSLITHLSNVTTLGNVVVGEGRHTLIQSELASFTPSGTVSQPVASGASATLTALEMRYFEAAASGTGNFALSGGPTATAVTGIAPEGGGQATASLISSTIIASNPTISQPSFSGVTIGSNTPHNVVQPSLIANFVVRIK